MESSAGEKVLEPDQRGPLTIRSAETPDHFVMHNTSEKDAHCNNAYSLNGILIDSLTGARQTLEHLDTFKF